MPVCITRVKCFDVRSQIAQELQPAVLMKRGAGDDSTRNGFSHAKIAPSGEWHILHERFSNSERQLQWSVNRSDLQIVIPLFDYLLPDPNPEVLVRFGAQAGALTAVLASQLRSDCLPIKMLLTVGNVFQRPDGKQGFQVWAGFAACFENRGE